MGTESDANVTQDQIPPPMGTENRCDHISYASFLLKNKDKAGVDRDEF